MLHNIRKIVISVATTGGLLVTLVACQPTTAPVTAPPPTNQSNLPELEWARAALERNPALKVLSVDTKGNSIKVQLRSSEAVFSVSPGELAAIPIADLVALTQAPTTPPPSRAATITEEPVTDATHAPRNETPTPQQYTVNREDGRVRVTGPGVAIESQPNKAASTAASKAVKDEPLICEGRRMMHLDGRKLTVDGNAITIRGGCEVHLTNSSIEATGVGITIDNGSIHIANSTVQGESASLQMEARAKVYIRNSQFIGISRRDAGAELQDMGGNRWQTSPNSQ